MDPLPEGDVRLDGATLTRHEKAALWMSLQQLRIYDVRSFDTDGTSHWDAAEIADGKNSVIERLANGDSERSSLSSLGSEDITLIQRALGYYVFTNESCSRGEKRRARELIQRFEDVH